MALASRAKRSAKAGSSPLPGGRIFSATTRSSCFWRALYTAPMPPRPMNSSTSSWGKNCASCSTVGGTKDLPRASPRAESVVAMPISTPLPSPAFMRHSGQSPWGAPAGTGRRQAGQIDSASITGSPLQELSIAERRLHAPGGSSHRLARTRNRCRNSDSTSSGEATVWAISSMRRWRYRRRRRRTATFTLPSVIPSAAASRS